MSPCTRFVIAASIELGNHIAGKTVVKIGNVAHKPTTNKLYDELLAQAVDIHRLTAYPMYQALFCLRRTIDRHAAKRYFAILLHNTTATTWAHTGHLPARTRRVFFGHCALKHRPHYFGNNVARFMHNNGIAHTHVAASNFVEIVQGSACNG